MRFFTAVKLIISLLILVLLTIFYFQNTMPTDIQFPFTRVFHVRLIYLLLISYGLGVLTAICVVMKINAYLEKRRKLEETEDLVEEE